MLFPIDHGNYAIKTKNFCFTSGLAEYPVRPPLATDVIEYDGKFWALTGQRIPYMRDKTKDDRYFILTLFAIAKEMMASGDILPFADVDLALGLPPEHYSVLKERFSQYFKRGSVKFVYNDKPSCLMFKRTFVYPQAYAAVVPQSRTLIGTSRMFVIDIGGYTTDVLLLRNGKPDLQFCRSLEIGIITMNNDIIGKVSALHDMKIEDDHISAILQNQETILPKDVVNTIYTSAKHHAGGILDKLRELQVDLRSNPAIFIGGGASLFKPFIEESPMVVKSDFILDQKANAIGYEMLAAAQMKNTSPQNLGGNTANAGAAV